MQRGTIILTKFPFTDLSSTKRRPGLIVSAKLSNESDAIVAFISSVVPLQPELTDYMVDVQHEDFAITGLKKASVIKLDKLATINFTVISGEIGHVSDKTMGQIDNCLKKALGLF